MNRATQQPHHPAIDPWAMLRRHRMRFAVAAFVGVAIVLVAGFFMPRQYQAEAVFERRNDMVLTEITNTGATRSFQNPRQSLVKEVTGDVAIDSTVDKVAAELETRGRSMDINERDRLRADMRRRLNVSFDFATDPADRVRLSFTGHDPLVARLAVNTLVEIYIEQSRAGMDARLRESVSFFENEVKRCREQIEKIEDKMLSFELDHAQLIPDNPNNIHVNIADLQKQLIEARQQHDAAKLQVEALRQQLAETPKTTPTVTHARNPELTRLEERLRQLSDQRSKHLLVDRMKQEHPDIVALDKQIDAIKEQIDGTEVEVVASTTHSDNPQYADVSLLLTQAESAQQAAKGQIALLSQELERINKQSDELYPVRAEYKALSREVAQAQRQLNFWEDNLRRVQTTLSAEHGNRGVQLSFIKPAGEIRRAVSPNFMQVLLAALIVGGAAGALRVFLVHRADQTFEQPDELARAVDLPLLGTVSPILSAAQTRLQWAKNWIWTPLQFGAMALVVLILTSLAYIDLERPDLWARLKRQSEHYTTALGLADDKP